MELEKRLELSLAPPISIESAPVVGWPPVRSSRRNLAAAGQQREKERIIISKEEEEEEEEEMYVKINMEGVPIGRKVNLSSFNNYQNLSHAVDQLFSSLLPALTASSVDGDDDNDKTKEKNIKKESCDVKRQYTLVYEDIEGDKVLVGDVPWELFISTVKRLHVIKSSPVFSISNRKHGRD